MRGWSESGRSSAGIVVTDFRESSRPASARPSSARPGLRGGPTAMHEATQMQRPVSAKVRKTGESIKPDLWGVRLDAEARASQKRKAAEAARKKIGGVLSFAKQEPVVKKEENLDERLERVLSATPRPLRPFDEAKIVLSQELKVPLWHAEQAPTPAALEAARQCAIHFGPTSGVKQRDEWRKIPPLPLQKIVIPTSEGDGQIANEGNESEGEQEAGQAARTSPVKRRKSIVEQDVEVETDLMERIKHAARHEPVMPTRRGSLAIATEPRFFPPSGAVQQAIDAERPLTQRPSTQRPPTATRPQTARPQTARRPLGPSARPQSARPAAPLSARPPLSSHGAPPPLTSRGIRQRDRRPLWLRLENALAAGKQQRESARTGVVMGDLTEEKWEILWHHIDHADAQTLSLQKALVNSKQLHLQPKKAYRAEEEEQMRLRARSIRSQWQRDAKHKEMMKGYQDKEDEEERRRTAAAERKAERERLKDEEDQQRLGERKRHATRLCRIVLQALATDPDTGLAIDPKDVFRELDDDKSGSLDIDEFVQGLDAVKCKLEKDDLEILWEFLGGAETGEVMYTSVVEVLYQANEEALRGQRPSEEKRLKMLANSSIDYVAAKIERKEQSAKPSVTPRTPAKVGRRAGRRKRSFAEWGSFG